MSDKIQYEAFDKIDNKLDEIEVLFEDLPLIREDKENLIDSLYELYCDLEKAIDRYHEEWEFDQEVISSSLKQQNDEKELREKDARITEALSPSLRKEIEDHIERYSSVPFLEGDDDNALMEEL